MKNQYLVSFDDSSDEEDSVEEYNVMYEVPPNREKVAEKYHKLSFIANALGVKLFYSKPVQVEYYKLKGLHLSYKEEQNLPKKENIAEWVHDCLKNALIIDYFRLPDSNENITDLICKDFLKQYKAELNDIVNYAIGNIREFLKLLTRNKLEEKFNEHSSSFNELVRDYINTKFSEELFNTVIHASKKEWTLENLKSVHDLKKRIKDFIDRDELDQEINNLPSTNGGNISFSAANKEKVSKKMSEEPQVLIKKAIKKIHFTLKYSPNKAIFKKAVEVELINEKMQELYLNKENSSIYNEVDDLLMEGGFISLNYNNTREYLKNTLCNDNIWTEFLCSWIKFFNKSKHEFVANNIQHRTILEDSYIFDLSTEHDSFYHKFLATLRLCNRSIKRVLRDREDLDGAYNYLEDESYSRAWKFPASNHAVIDIHKISTSKEAVRTDHTESLGSYRSIFQVMQQVKESLNSKISVPIKKVNDSDIAYWICLIRHGKTLEQLPYFDNAKGYLELVQPRIQENILKNLVKITYVMLGSEVTRNPASLIYNNMVLDLITQGGMSWKEALDCYTTQITKKILRKNGEIEEKQKEIADGGEMPMSMKEAVMAARSLHNEYSECMPNQYAYDRHKCNPYSRIDELSSRGYKIMIKWLATKFQEKFKENYKEQDYFVNNENASSLKDDKLQEAVDLIVSIAQDEWVPIVGDFEYL